jgi:outer membrane protein TolC
LDQIKALEAALKSTEGNYREQEKNYRFGQATNLDVIQALNSFQDSKRTLDRTRYLAFSAWAELKAATAQVTLAQVLSEGGEGL